MKQQEEKKGLGQVEQDDSNRLEFDTDRDKDILERVRIILGKE